MNLLLATLFLLSTVTLCGAQSTSTAPEISTIAPTVGVSAESGTTTGATAETATGATAETATGSATGASTATAVQPPPEPSSGGLSGGAIAGITIGTIAGVAALGGGVYGLLKYTNKI